MIRNQRGATLVAVLATVLALGVTACGGSSSSSSSGGTRTTTTSSAAPPTTVATPVGTVEPGAPGVALSVFFLRDGKVGVGHRRVAPTQAVARAALDQLITGPNAVERGAGLTSLVPATTRVDALSIADGVATVTLTPALADLGAGRAAAEAQVVFTLTQFPTVTSVRFGTSAAATRATFAAVTPAILLLSLAPGDVVRSPVTLSGTNNTFEATVNAQVLSDQRRVLASGVTTGSGPTGAWGTFSFAVDFPTANAAGGFVRVFDYSAKDGSMIDLVEVPVRFG